MSKKNNNKEIINKEPCAARAYYEKHYGENGISKATPAQSLPKNRELTVSEKLGALWHDDRSYLKRLLIAAFPIFCFAFMFILFGPLEIALSNSEALAFDVGNVALAMGAICLVFFVAVTAIVALLRGKVFNGVITAVFSFALGCYIQCNMLNGSVVTQLVGDAIPWHELKGELALSLTVWALVFILPYFLLHLYKKGWRLAVRYISLFLVVIQIAGLTVAGIDAAQRDYATSDYDGKIYSSTLDMHTYGTKKNVLVIILDRLDATYITDIIDDKPDFFEKRLSGFTYYNNATPTFARTLPGANHVLTGAEEGAYLLPKNEFLDSSWTSVSGKSLLDILNEKEYNVGLYTDIATLIGDETKLSDKVDNLADEPNAVNYPALIKNMLAVSSYRYLPLFIKPFFWLYSDDIGQDVILNNEKFESDEGVSFIEQLPDFKVTENGSFFKFFHFNGSHSPCHLTEKGEYSELETNPIAATMGSFELLSKLFTEMKEKGVYENTEIFILGDHGYARSDRKNLEEIGKPHCIGLFHKKAGASDEKMVTSSAPVSQKNVPASILKAIGYESYSDFGLSLDEIPENPENPEQYTRYFYKSVYTGTPEHEGRVYKYAIVGDANKFENWTRVGEFEVTGYFY